MARLLRVQFEGAIYHVTLRGNARRDIFLGDKDWRRFVDVLSEKVEEYGIRLYLYCAMSNHAHLVFETPQGNLSRFMQALETAYTVYFNLRHRKSGHVLQGRYGAKLVEGDEYLMRLTRYVHLNPVFVDKWEGKPLAERRKYLRGYRWSSYRGYAGLGRPEVWVDRAPVLEMMGKGARRQRREYRRFVEAGLAETDEEFSAILRESRMGIGSEEFCAWVMDKHYDLVYGSGKKIEDAALRKRVSGLSGEEVIGVVADGFGKGREWIGSRHRDGEVRPVTAWMLCKYAGMTQRESSRCLGLKTGTAVSRQIARLKKKVMEDKRLHAILAGIEASLSERRKDAMFYGKG